MADATSVTSTLATLGANGWVPTGDSRYAGATAGVTNAIRSARAARIARRSVGPVIVAPLWTTGTAYALHQTVRLSNGQHLTCNVAGTSGASEPTGYLYGRPITDNTVTWRPTPFVKSASDAAAPTVSVQASAAAAGLTFIDFTPSGAVPPSTAAIRGGWAANVSNVYLGPYSFASGPAAGSGNATSNATASLGGGQSAANVYRTDLWELEFVVVDSKFGIIMHNAAGPVYIEVDDQPLQGSTVLATGSSGECITLDYNGVVAKRKVRIVGMDTSPVVQGVAITSNGYLVIPETTTDNILCLGDSIGITTAGNTTNAGGNGTVNYWLERLLGVQALLSANVGGSGYVSANANTYNVPSILSNTTNQALFAAFKPSHVIISSGFNDRASTRATVLAAALATWQATRSQFPTAKITITDGHSGTSGPDANALSLASDLKALFTTWGDINARFIQIIGTSTSTAFIQGANYDTQSVVAGNSCLFNGDVNHPNASGNYYLANRMAQAIVDAWGNDY